MGNLTHKLIQEKSDLIELGGGKYVSLEWQIRHNPNVPVVPFMLITDLESQMEEINSFESQNPSEYYFLRDSIPGDERNFYWLNSQKADYLNKERLERELEYYRGKEPRASMILSPYIDNNGSLEHHKALVTEHPNMEKGFYIVSFGYDDYLCNSKGEVIKRNHKSVRSFSPDYKLIKNLVELKKETEKAKFVDENYTSQIEVVISLNQIYLTQERIFRERELVSEISPQDYNFHQFGRTGSKNYLSIPFGIRIASIKGNDLKLLSIYSSFSSTIKDITTYDLCVDDNSGNNFMGTEEGHIATFLMSKANSYRTKSPFS